MAYGVKYNGTIEGLDGILYTFEILERDYVGGSTPLLAADKGLPVKWGAGAKNDPYVPILASFADLTLFEKTTTVQNEIFNADENKYRLQIKKGASVYWIGKILTDIYGASLDVRPAPSLVSAIDGLGVLQNKDFTLTTRQSLIKTIAEILALTGLELDIHIALDWFTKEITSAQDPADKIRIDRELFRNDDGTSQKAFSVLEKLMTRFELQIYQKDGVWKVIQQELLANATYKYFTYDKNAVQTGSVAAHNPAVTIPVVVDQYSKRRARGTKTALRPYKNTKVRFIPKSDHKRLLYNSDFEIWDGANFAGWAKTGTITISTEEISPLEATRSLKIETLFSSSYGEVDYIELTDVSGIVGVGHGLRFSFLTRWIAGPGVFYPEVLRAASFEIQVGDYFLMMNQSSGALSWMHKDAVAAVGDHGQDPSRYIAVPTAGPAQFVYVNGAGITVSINTPVNPNADAGGIVRFRFYKPFHGYSSSLGTIHALYDDIKVEVLPAGNVGPGIEVKAEDSVSQNDAQRDPVEFQLGDGFTSAARTAITIADDVTFAKNWKRGAYGSEELIEDCEDAWNESVDANVTADADTVDKKVGTASARFVVGAGAAAGAILATEVVGSLDLRAYKGIILWFKSSVALAAGDLQILLDNSANCASPLESLNLPAALANTWTRATLTFATPVNLSALISVGVKMVVDKGAFTLRLDDLRAVSTRSIDKILAESFLRIQKVTPLDRHNATYIKRSASGIALEIGNVLVIGSKRYAQLAFERDLKRGRAIGEWSEIRADDTNIAFSETTITDESGGGGSGGTGGSGGPGESIDFRKQSILVGNYEQALQTYHGIEVDNTGGDNPVMLYKVADDRWHLGKRTTSDTGAQTGTFTLDPVLARTSTDTLTNKQWGETFRFSVDNTFDFGLAGSNRPRDAYIARNLTVGGTSTLGAGTITSDRAAIFQRGSGGQQWAVNLDNNQFRLEDVTGGTTPVIISATAPTNSLFLSSTGNLTVSGWVLGNKESWFKDGNATGAAQKVLKLGNMSDAPSTEQYYFETTDLSAQLLKIYATRWQGGLTLQRSGASGTREFFRITSIDGFDANLYLFKADGATAHFSAVDSLVTIGAADVDLLNTKGLRFGSVTESQQGVEWFASGFGVGYGHRLRTADVGVRSTTQLYLEARNNATSWNKFAEFDATTGGQAVWFNTGDTVFAGNVNIAKASANLYLGTSGTSSALYWGAVNTNDWYQKYDSGNSRFVIGQVGVAEHLHLLNTSGSFVSKHHYPMTTDTYDVGSYTQLWRSSWISTMNALVFAENVIQIVGGKMMIGKNQGTLPAVSSGQTQIDFGSTLGVNDFIEIRAHDTSGAVKKEIMQIISLVSGTTYNVTRDVENAHVTDPAWADGTPWFNLGYNGTGRIELDSINTPRISMIKQGTTYSSQTELLRVGDLNGNWGYASETYGFAVGEYASGKNSITIEQANGIRLFSGTTVTGKWALDGSITVGEVAVGKPNFIISTGTGFSLRLNTVNQFSVVSGPLITIGEVGASLSHIEITAGLIEFKTNTTTKISLSTAGVITVGEVAASQGNVLISSGQIDVRVNTTSFITLTSAGVLTVKSASSGKRVEIVSNQITFIDSNGTTVGNLDAGLSTMQVLAGTQIDLNINGGARKLIMTTNYLHWNLGFGDTPSNGAGTIEISNVGTAPTSSHNNGGSLYAQSGALKWRGSSGTVTTMANAEPHCPVCGTDYMKEFDSSRYGYLAVCLNCLTTELGARPWIIRGPSRLAA